MFSYENLYRWLATISLILVSKLDNEKENWKMMKSKIFILQWGKNREVLS